MSNLRGPPRPDLAAFIKGIIMFLNDNATSHFAKLNRSVAVLTPPKYGFSVCVDRINILCNVIAILSIARLNMLMTEKKSNVLVRLAVGEYKHLSYH